MSFGAVMSQEREITGDLEVLPDVVRDREIDVTLQMRVIGEPTTRSWVQVEPLRLLLSVARSATGTGPLESP